MANNNQKTVVVLGGSLGGLAVTHRLLKYTLPREKELKVVLVSKNSHFYWNLASVRAVVPGLVADDALLQPIEPGLRQYRPGSVDFIVGAATRLDAAAKTVSVCVSDAAGGDRVLAYDYLVVATGADPADVAMPWKAAGSYDACLASLHATAAAIAGAAHIVVAGGGATGVEVAAEIKYEFPAKTVVLLSAGRDLVGGDACAARVERELVRLGVDVRKGVRATRIDAAAPDGRTRVALSASGEPDEELATDLYLPTTGLTPNTAFVPDHLLTDSRYLDVDDCMRLRAARDAWALGDVVSKPRAGFLFTEIQAAAVANNIDRVLQGKDQQPAKGPPVDALLFSIGRARGAGRLGFIPVPSLFVWAVKGRTLGVQRTPKYVNGTMW